ncbi:MAG: hypothetical protein LCH46_04195 [Proteobacteria bacterium]|nr:hypothetical protein [Pseudomonadota bacterium]
MKNKKHIGKLISIKFTDRKTPIYGIVIDCSDDWTLMKYNPVDYIVDGYVIIRHKSIEGFCISSEEKFRHKVIKLKGIEVTKKDSIPLNDLNTILKYLTEKFGVFQFQTKSETACYLGRLKSLDSKHLVIDCLDTNGKWDGQMKFRPNDIRVIEFDTDYINSLKLVSGNKRK